MQKSAKKDDELNERDHPEWSRKAVWENNKWKRELEGSSLRNNVTTSKETSNAERKKLLYEINSLKDRLEVTLKSATTHNSSPNNVSEEIRYLQEALDPTKKENVDQRKII